MIGVTSAPPGSLRKFEATPHSPTPWNQWLYVRFGPAPAHEEASNFWHFGSEKMIIGMMEQ